MLKDVGMLGPKIKETNCNNLIMGGAQWTTGYTTINNFCMQEMLKMHVEIT